LRSVGGGFDVMSASGTPFGFTAPFEFWDSLIAPWRIWGVDSCSKLIHRGLAFDTGQLLRPSW